MTAERVIASLTLPPESHVEQRVPKKLLVENGAPTSADKRHINDGVEELFWVAALKPTTIGVPEFRDATREYLEIAILTLTLRAGAKATRLVELVHRAVPYPVLLVTSQEGTVGLSLGHKRLAQNEAGRLVLDGALVFSELTAGAHVDEWLPTLALAAQPRSDILALYGGWVARVEALQAARITGRLFHAADPNAQEARRVALGDHERLRRDIAALRTAAAKEKQMNRRVELNLQLKRLEAELAAAAGNL